MPESTCSSCTCRLRASTSLSVDIFSAAAGGVDWGVKLIAPSLHGNFLPEDLTGVALMPLARQRTDRPMQCPLFVFNGRKAAPLAMLHRTSFLSSSLCKSEGPIIRLSCQNTAQFALGRKLPSAWRGSAARAWGIARPLLSKETSRRRPHRNGIGQAAQGEIVQGGYPFVRQGRAGCGDTAEPFRHEHPLCHRAGSARTLCVSR